MRFHQAAKCVWLRSKSFADVFIPYSMYGMNEMSASEKVSPTMCGPLCDRCLSRTASTGASFFFPSSAFAVSVLPPIIGVNISW